MVEDHFDFDLFDLEPEFSRFKGFSELPFQDREYRFDLVSLMVP
jgi:hypothetical protein